MLYKKLNGGGEIHTWFPKSIYHKKISVNNLKQIEKSIKSLKYIKQKTFEFEVNSSYTTQKNPLHKEKKLKLLFNQILSSAREYCSQLGYSQLFCNDLQIESSWFNISKKGDYLQKHIHPNSLLSGVFYIKCNDEDFIRFYDEDMLVLPSSYNDLSFTNTTYVCEPGTLLLFKSNLPHSTNKQISKEKIVISFNIK